MPIYVYSAAAKDGKIVKGEREAENQKVLAQTLKTEGLFLLEAKEKGKTGLASWNISINISDLLSRLRPVGVVDKMFFARNLAVMVAAGLSLTRALDALAQESANPKFKKILTEVNNSVIKGKSFADSLRLHEKVFGPLFINMVEVGETTGKLTLVLKLIANQMKKDYNLKKRVKGAMFYPAIIIMVLLGVGTLMMIYVVPTLTSTIKELGVELPFTTKIIVTVSDLILNYAIWFLIALAALVFIFIRILKTQKGKEIFDRISLKLPIFGALIKKFNIARFCRTLAYLLTSGVPVVRSLEITSSVLGNTIYKDAVREASSEIQKGKQLNKILAAHPLIFQPVVLQMIQVGEETGKVSEMLLRLALFFEEDVTNTTKNLSTIIEPILMIVIGAAVGFFAISMLQPIYSSLGNI
ncbi:MAG: type II secretion system F family protein [Candidatus Sungiibacteriota bacterium]|uniref:Type II secretion system F family protein n=1 Tax=Candidatus Sungiibacteriota bacterium TaxID=2750080 RepID=A0A7T5RK44_9BACT|nr:MAG: type II secretion system F family protein [Candidatus Sungbacteria bacterium]